MLIFVDLEPTCKGPYIAVTHPWLILLFHCLAFHVHTMRVLGKYWPYKLSFDVCHGFVWCSYTSPPARANGTVWLCMPTIQYNTDRIFIYNTVALTLLIFYTSLCKVFFLIGVLGALRMPAGVALLQSIERTSEAITSSRRIQVNLWRLWISIS